MDNQILTELFEAVKAEADQRGQLILCKQSAQQENLNGLLQKWGAAMLTTKKVKARLGL